MRKYGIVLLYDNPIGAWKVLDDNKLELNLEDGYVESLVQRIEVTDSAELHFMLDPEAVD